MAEATRMRLVVTYLDGREPVEVTAGQAEMSKWERESFGCAATMADEEAPVTFVRYLAWAALKRQGLKVGWAAWDDQVDEVNPADDGKGEAEVVPTRPGPRPGR
jgi:hypothetical protein